MSSPVNIAANLSPFWQLPHNSLYHISLLVWTVTYRMNLTRRWTSDRLKFCNCYGIQPDSYQLLICQSLIFSKMVPLDTHLSSSGTLPALTFWIHWHCHAMKAFLQVASLQALTLLHWAGSSWHFEQLWCVACSCTAWTWRWRHCDLQNVRNYSYNDAASHSSRLNLQQHFCENLKSQRGKEIFFPVKHPIWLWSPPNLLYSGYGG